MPVFRTMIGVMAIAWLSAGMAPASPVMLDTWYEFKLAGMGKPLQASDDTIIPFFDVLAVPAPDAPWEITLKRDALLIVTDAFLSIDRFAIYDQGDLLGITSEPVPGTDCYESLGCAIFDPAFSKSVFYLDAGFHSITGLQLEGLVGAGAFIITTAVPLPAGLPLMLSSLAVLGISARFRQRR